MIATMKLHERAWSVLRRGWARARRQPGDFRRFETSPLPAARAVGRALAAAVEGRLTAEERAWAERIEALRGRAAASRRPVRVGTLGTERTTSLGEHTPTSSKHRRWCVFLFRLVREFRPGACLELGTCAGISAAWQAAALELEGRGRLVTLEDATEVASAAREHLEELGLGRRVEVLDGRFGNLLPETLERLGSSEMVFLHGRHDQTAALAYFERALPRVPDGGIVVLDGIDRSAGMRRAWEAVRTDGRLAAAVDLGRLGVVVVDRSWDGPPRQFRAAL